MNQNKQNGKKKTKKNENIKNNIVSTQWLYAKSPKQSSESSFSQLVGPKYRDNDDCLYVDLLIFEYMGGYWLEEILQIAR